jgi:5-deoxy-D-glucuronate isomerase
LQNLYHHGNGNDVVAKASDGDVVLVRDGFHPVVAGPGCDVYYLNFLGDITNNVDCRRFEPYLNPIALETA